MICPAECESVDLERAMNFQDANFIVEEKLDGIRALVTVIKGQAVVTGRRWRMPGVLETISRDGGLSSIQYHESLNGCCFDGELISGRLHVFDLPIHCGNDIRDMSLACRKKTLASLADFLPIEFLMVQSFLCVQDIGNFKEGIVWKDLRARYGHGFYKSKRVVTIDVRIKKMMDNGVAEAEGRGKIVGVPHGTKEGDIVEVEAFSVFQSGKLRNGRFVRTRDDK